MGLACRPTRQNNQHRVVPESMRKDGGKGRGKGGREAFLVRLAKRKIRRNRRNRGLEKKRKEGKKEEKREDNNKKKKKKKKENGERKL